MSNLDLDDLMMEKAQNLGLGNTMPYNNSKFANALFTKQLAKRGSIKAYSICPGLAKTEIFRHYSAGVRTLMNVMSVFGIPIDKVLRNYKKYCDIFPRIVKVIWLTKILKITLVLMQPCFNVCRAQTPFFSAVLPKKLLKTLEDTSALENIFLQLKSYLLTKWLNVCGK